MKLLSLSTCLILAMVTTSVVAKTIQLPATLNCSMNNRSLQCPLPPELMVSGVSVPVTAGTYNYAVERKALLWKDGTLIVPYRQGVNALGVQNNRFKNYKVNVEKTVQQNPNWVYVKIAEEYVCASDAAGCFVEM